MVINFYGEGCFKITSSDTTILTDPFESGTGLSTPRLKPDVTIKTLTPLPLKRSDSFTVRNAGEYTFKNTRIDGFPLAEESTKKFLKSIFRLEVEGIRIALLGHLSGEPPTDIVKKLDKSDIVVVPGGGAGKEKAFIDQKTAAKIAKKLGAKIVLSAFHKVPGLKRAAGDTKDLAKEIGGKATTQEKLTIKKKDLAEMKGTQVITLKA